MSEPMPYLTGMKITQPQIGRFLVATRKRRKWTLPYAAERAGMNKGMLSAIEHGRNVQVDTLQKLLTAYRLKLSIR